MSNEIEIVKSPFVIGKKILSHMMITPMIISVKLPNGILITDPGQFQEKDEYEYTSDYSIDTVVP